MLTGKVPFFLNKYEKECENVYTYSPGITDCNKWYEIFRTKIINSMGKNYLPVCRISDGEFLTLLGYRWMGLNYPFVKVLRNNFNVVMYLFRKKYIINARTLPTVSSGEYDIAEVQKLKQMYGSMIAEIAKEGMLAVHLTIGKKPFQEHYFKSFFQYLEEYSIDLTVENYVPFYFIYALLAGDGKEALVNNKNVLLINSAEGEKKEKIIHSIQQMGAQTVYWKSISKNKSMFDKIDVDELAGCVDIVFVGAGIGKPNILLQLKKLDVPCIDAGYIFEVWADSDAGKYRPFCSYEYLQKNSREK